ncbi:CDP-alcohol phosphatidyltransferase family protein [Moraxella sp. VT-16-12]|uniref:CDP-alcohol phosphatidyltransferase family protein n=1 Tax=Moraxella sp. VT-16-12 TaxID=2014877 RepID=UPI000B7CD742|nr:CDP-alcohol phosphatidyltransferase family protein [Moraxella sp. VT-16-12]TWV82996.1 CDP-alcohol phosphatidyltransferase family protein [Moraxella sp. VT-16-12]
MSIYQFKRQFQNLLRPISQKLVAHGVHANHVTISAVVLSGGVAHVVAKRSQQNPAWWYALPAGLFIRMAMNAIDGMMAKEHGQASALGAVLNEVGDLVSDALLLFSLSSRLNHSNRHGLYRVMALSTISELVAIWASISTSKRANHGPLGKSDRALVLGVLGVYLGFRFTLSQPKARQLLIIAQLLLLKTIYNRTLALGYANTGVRHDAR